MLCHDDDGGGGGGGGGCETVNYVYPVLADTRIEEQTATV